jgi:hypothetical protein
MQQLAARADVLWTHHGGAGGSPVVAAVSPNEEPDEDISTVAAVGGNPPRGKTWKWRGKPGRARGGRQASVRTAAAPPCRMAAGSEFGCVPSTTSTGRGLSCVPRHVPGRETSRPGAA